MPQPPKEPRKRMLFLLILNLISIIAFSQNQFYKFEKLSTKDGLSHSNVYCIEQDHLGYMWFGTQDGLNKFDGYNFTVYRHEPTNPNSLSTSNFGKVYLDDEGIFWFGTYGGGLDRFDPKTNLFKHFTHDTKDPNSISSDLILFIYEDSYDDLWLGTVNGGISRYNRKEQKFKQYKPEPNNNFSFNDKHAKCICETKDGTLWIGSESGLYKYSRENDHFTNYAHNPDDKNSLASNNIIHLYADENDIIWIATHGAGLNSFDPKTETFRHFKYNTGDSNGLSDNDAEFIFKDSYGYLWIGTYEGGLNKFDPRTEQFTHFLHDPNNTESLSHNRVEYIFEDDSKNLWIATRGGGINKIDLKPKKFSNISHNPKDLNSLPHPSVMALGEDNEGNIWIGTDGGGLTKYNPFNQSITNLLNKIKNPGSLDLNEIRSIFIDKKGVIWVGTLTSGLNRIELKNNKYFLDQYLHDPNDPNSISSNVINRIIEDKDGTIWIATADGLNKLNKTGKPNEYSFKHYVQNPVNSSAYVNNFIAYIFIDSNERFWIGSYLGGLFEFLPKKEKFIKYLPSETLNSEFKREIHVLTIYEDHNKNLWLGTESNGVIKYDVEKNIFSTHPKNNELLSNMISAILEDDMGNLWISTTKGLSKYSSWNNKLINYTYLDGLESEGFNRNACLSCSDGKMYFGSISSLVYFNPLEVSNNPYLPNVVITDFKVLNKSLWNDNLLTFETIKHNNEKIELKPKDYFFTIEFAALDYTIPEQNKYKYMLEGLDEDWIDAFDNRSATYTNLNPGIYTFKVKGSNNDKVWNEEPTEIQIKVIPPFYKTIWFLLLLLAVIICIVFTYIKRRERKLVVEKEQLERKVEERTIEINKQKEELKSQAENLEVINKKLEGQQEQLEKLVKERTLDLEKAKEKAEQADELKSAFFANMSHEIRTPMNAIIGFSNLIDDKEIGEGQRTELTKLIKKNSNSLLALFDDIIDIAKIESDQLEIREKECQVHTVLKDVLLEFDDDIKSIDHITFKVNQEQIAYPLFIKCDPYRLTQILKKLVSNAIKFTEKGIIEFGYSLDFIDTKKEIMFFVRDTGIGLTIEQQKQIFSRFTKIENNKQKIYRGAGLGLTITKNLVELMGGTIHVESEVNKGSTFYFNIPYKSVKKEKKEKTLIKKTLSKYNWNNKKILIAEDEESNYKFLEMIIRKTSAELIWAKSGKEAIDFVKQANSFDLILMDIKMPEMDGLEAIREIRKENQQTPIIVQSAYAMPEDRNLSSEVGANDFIAKPIGSDRLLKIIDKHLNKLFH